MKRHWAVVGPAILLVACNQSASHALKPSSSPSTSPPPIAAASPTPPPSCVPAASYGLLVVNAELEVIDTCGKIAALTGIQPPSVQSCGAGDLHAVLEEAVSATSDRIFYRDGDTQVRSIMPNGQRADVTTMPGGQSTVSFFSVSPDDKRIAVLVEDLSAAETVSERLYVEDLVGKANHVDIFSTTQPKSGGTTLWPVGWHQGQLVVGVVPVCSDSVQPDPIKEWHVVDPATGNRIATIAFPGCVMGRWPSATGFTCATFAYQTIVLDWSGNEKAVLLTGFDSNDVQSGVSPGDLSVFASSGAQDECGNAPDTCIAVAKPGVSDFVEQAHGDAEGVAACLWINHDYLLTPGALIGVAMATSEATPAPEFNLEKPRKTLPPWMIPLQARGTCVGRFPGGL